MITTYGFHHIILGTMSVHSLKDKVIAFLRTDNVSSPSIDCTPDLTVVEYLGALMNSKLDFKNRSALVDAYMGFSKLHDDETKIVVDVSCVYCTEIMDCLQISQGRQNCVMGVYFTTNHGRTFYVLHCETLKNSRDPRTVVAYEEKKCMLTDTQMSILADVTPGSHFTVMVDQFKKLNAEVKQEPSKKRKLEDKKENFKSFEEPAVCVGKDGAPYYNGHPGLDSRKLSLLEFLDELYNDFKEERKASTDKLLTREITKKFDKMLDGEKVAVISVTCGRCGNYLSCGECRRVMSVVTTHGRYLKLDFCVDIDVGQPLEESQKKYKIHCEETNVVLSMDQIKLLTGKSDDVIVSLLKFAVL